MLCVTNVNLYKYQQKKSRLLTHALNINHTSLLKQEYYNINVQ